MRQDMDKYQLLHDLVKHQDSQLNFVLTWNVVLQGGLLAAVQTDFVTRSATWLLGVQLLGMVLAVCWVMSGDRLRSYLAYYVQELRGLEARSPELADFPLWTKGRTAIKPGQSKFLHICVIPALLGVMWGAWFGCTLAPHVHAMIVAMR